MNTPNETPNIEALLSALRAESPSERLAALQALSALPEGLARALPLLGPLALDDPDPAVRQLARDLLAAGSRNTRSIPWTVRGEILRQLDQWQISGRLTADQADLLRDRYNFDLRPTPPSPEARRALAGQIESWLAQGLISAEQAAALRRSLEPQQEQPRPAPAATPGRTPAPLGTPAVPAAAAASAAPAASGVGASPVNAGAVSRQTVIQALFSELTIRIALYLGGFLIVSAALILAAILEVARLPILLGLTGAAGLGAALSRKGLRQGTLTHLPSFVLFAIFAALLPIDGRIYVDLFFPPGQATTGFWSLVWLVTAVALAGGALLYASWLYSLLALASLEGAAVMFVIWRDRTPEFSALLTVLAALIGLTCVLLLKHNAREEKGEEPRLDQQVQGRVEARVQQQLDPRPLFWATQLLATGALVFILLIDWINAVEGTQGNWDWISQALAWLLGIVFYLLADLGFLAFGLFPFLAAGALLCFAPALFAAFPDLTGRALTAALTITGLLYTAGADFLHLRFGTRGKLGRYTLPVFLAALALLGWAALSGLDKEIASGMVVLLAVALVYAGLHAQKRRPWLWFVALLSGLGAYAAFFSLPMAETWRIDGSYQFLIAGLLLALPDLLRGPDQAAGRAWTGMARWFGAVVLALTVLVTWLRLGSGPDAWTDSAQMWVIGAVVSALSGLVCLGYALRFRRAGLGWGFTALMALAYLCILEQFKLPYRALPVLGLALLSWAAGFALRIARERHANSPDAASDSRFGWSLILRSSGLALAALLVFQLPFEPGAGVGLALLAGGALALVELWLTGLGGLEFLSAGLLAGGAVRLVSLLNWDLPQPGTGLLVAALVVLGLDLALTVYGDRFPVFRWKSGQTAIPQPAGSADEIKETGETGAAGVDRAAGGEKLAGNPPTGSQRNGPSPWSRPADWLAFGPTSPLARWIERIIGGALAALAVLALLLEAVQHLFVPGLPLIGVSAAEYLLLGGFLLYAAWVYRQPLVAYAPAGLLALALLFALRWAGQPQWLAPEVALGVFYYLAAYLLRDRERPFGWVSVLRFSGLALAMIAALVGWFYMDQQGGLFASLPIAAAATLYAIEAFRRRNVWLGFPANGLYLLAYFVVLIELKVDQPQYYSVGVAVLGILMHYLLLRTGNSLAAFLTGMVSQFVLLGTTYIQMYSTNQLNYFVMLFFEGLLVLAYGIAIRSRSLVFTPLGFIVVGVITVVLSVLSGVPTAIIIGCTGVALLTGGILAVLMRDRLMKASDKLGERLGGWKA